MNNIFVTTTDYMNRLDELKNKLLIINKEISELSMNPFIITYEDLKETKDNLNNSINKEINRIQSECKHPIWYHLSTESDCYEGRKYFTCQCLECGKIKESGYRNFNLMLFKKESYNTVKEEYNKLKSITSNQDVLFTILKEKFIDKVTR